TKVSVDRRVVGSEAAIKLCSLGVGARTLEDAAVVLQIMNQLFRPFLGMRQSIAVVVHVHANRNTYLLQVRDTTDGRGLLARLFQRGKEHRNKHGDDGDHDEQFDESETNGSSPRRLTGQGTAHAKAT